MKAAVRAKAQTEAAKRSGVAMSRHCFAGPTRKVEDPMESRFPAVYLKANGAAFPINREGSELSACGVQVGSGGTAERISRMRGASFRGGHSSFGH